MEDSFLYVLRDTYVERLNLSELWLRTSSPSSRPDFEVIRFSGEQPLSNMILPYCGRRLRHAGLDLMIVDSKVYQIGGFEITRERDEPIREYTRCASDDSRVHTGSTLPSMMAPKSNPMVMTMDSKFYVLSTLQEPKVNVGTYWSGRIEEVKVAKYQSLHFEVFDPVSRLWKVLPNPPFKDSCIVPQHFTLGHKLVIQNKNTGNNYWFDTRKEKWKQTPNMSNAPLFGVAQFKDFLIGIPLHCQHVLIYKLNSNGVPIRCGELVELRNLFFASVNKRSACITLVNDSGLMFLMCAGIDKDIKFPDELRVRVALFQVFTISNDTCLHAHIKTTETYSVACSRWVTKISFCLSGEDLKNLDDEKLMTLEKWKFFRDDKLVRMEERLRELGATRFLQVLERLKILSDDKLMRKVEELEKLNDDKLVRMEAKFKKISDFSFMYSLEGMQGRKTLRR